MRIHACYVYEYKKGVLTKNSNEACWASVPKTKTKVEIYIAQFDEPETILYQELLIGIVNQITPCSIVAIDMVKYIKFLTLGTYDRSLILLNFVRNLWYEPYPGYSVRFFEALKISDKKHTDPLARLTWANKEACATFGCVYNSPGHSNVHNASSLKIKMTKELLEWRGTNTRIFLT